MILDEGKMFATARRVSHLHTRPRWRIIDAAVIATVMAMTMEPTDASERFRRRAFRTVTRDCHICFTWTSRKAEQGGGGLV